MLDTLLIIIYSAKDKKGKATTKKVHGINTGWKEKTKNNTGENDDDDDGPMVQYGGIIDDNEAPEPSIQARAISSKMTVIKVKLFTFLPNSKLITIRKL